VTGPTRATEITLVLDASLEDTWKALTDAGELTRWFPLQADVEAGPGGAVAWRWHDQFAMISRIDDWQPPQRLRLVQDREPPHAADGAPLAGQSPTRLVIEFTLETHHGKTRLRLIHSGFGSGDAWDDELEGVTNGWNYELRSLAHYLAHHRGRDRHYGLAWTTTSRSSADVWDALTGPGGMSLLESARHAGSPFTLTTRDGTTLSGVSQLYVPEREWSGTVTELDNGLVRLSTWRGGGRTGVNIWFSTWCRDRASRASTLGQSAQSFLDRRIRQA
jgi:uncharacterized protein YndB with AHSA1/START domain